MWMVVWASIWRPTAGSVLDRYEVTRGRDEILRKYKEEGYYYAEVTLDEPALYAPHGHAWVESAPRWHRLEADLSRLLRQVA